MIRDERVKLIKFAGEQSGLNFLKCPRDLNDGEFVSSKNFIPEEIGGLENRKGIKYLNFKTDGTPYLSSSAMATQTIFRDTDFIVGGGNVKNISYTYPPISNVGIDEIVDLAEEETFGRKCIYAICSTKPVVQGNNPPTLTLEHTNNSAAVYTKFTEMTRHCLVFFSLFGLSQSGLVLLDEKSLDFGYALTPADVKTIKMSITGVMPDNCICYVIKTRFMHTENTTGGDEMFISGGVLLYTTAQLTQLEFPNADCLNIWNKRVVSGFTSTSSYTTWESYGFTKNGGNLRSYDKTSIDYDTSTVQFVYPSNWSKAPLSMTGLVPICFNGRIITTDNGGGNFSVHFAIPREYNKIIEHILKYRTSSPYTNKTPFMKIYAAGAFPDLEQFSGLRMQISTVKYSEVSISHDYSLDVMKADLSGIASLFCPMGAPANNDTKFSLAIQVHFDDISLSSLTGVYNRQIEYFTAQGDARFALFELSSATKGILSRVYSKRTMIGETIDSIDYAGTTSDTLTTMSRRTPILFSFMPHCRASSRNQTTYMDNDGYFQPFFIKVNGNVSVVSPAIVKAPMLVYRGVRSSAGHYTDQLAYNIGSTAISESFNPLCRYVFTPAINGMDTGNPDSQIIEPTKIGLDVVEEYSAPFLDLESFPLFKKAINYRDRVLFYDSSDSLKTIPSTVSDNRFFDRRLWGEFVQGKGEVVEAFAFARNPASASISEVQYFFYPNKILAISGTWDDGAGVPVDFAINEISKEKGILCKGAVSQINGGMIFVGNDNIYFIDYNGGLLQPLGAKVLPILRDRSKKVQGSGATLIDDDRSKMYCVNYAGYLRFMIGHKLDMTNDETYKKYELWFDGRDGMTYSWSGIHEYSFSNTSFTALPTLVKPTITGLKILDSQSSLESSNYNLMGSYGKDLIIYDKGYQDLGNNYRSEFISPDYTFKKPSLLKSFVGCGLTIEAEGAGSAFATVVCDGGAQSSGQLDYNFAMDAIWDVSKWDEAVWQDPITEFKRIIFNERPMGRSGTFKLVTFGGHKVKLQEIELYFRIKNRSYF